MIYLWIALALLLGLIASLLFLKAKVIIEYKDSDFRITFRSGLIKLSLNTEAIKKISGRKKGKNEEPGKKTEEPHEKFFDKVRALKEKYLEIKTVADMFLRCMRYKISFSEFYIHVRYGTGDAASTGTLYGAVWALIGNVYSFICRYFYISFPEVNLEPDFNKKMFEPMLRGIITVRPVHIIIAVLRSLRAYRQHREQKNEE